MRTLFISGLLLGQGTCSHSSGREAALLLESLVARCGGQPVRLVCLGDTFDLLEGVAPGDWISIPEAEDRLDRLCRQNELFTSMIGALLCRGGALWIRPALADFLLVEPAIQERLRQALPRDGEIRLLLEAASRPLTCGSLRLLLSHPGWERITDHALLGSDLRTRMACNRLRYPAEAFARTGPPRGEFHPTTTSRRLASLGADGIIQGGTAPGLRLDDGLMVCGLAPWWACHQEPVVAEMADQDMGPPALALLRWSGSEWTLQDRAILPIVSRKARHAGIAREDKGRLRPLLRGLREPEPCLPLGLELPGRLERPPERQAGQGSLRDEGADRHALRDQGWGLVVPAGQEQEYRAVLRDLLRLRSEETGREVHLYSAKAAALASPAQQRRWVRETLLMLPPEEQPAYLCIVGDLDLIPLGLQQILAEDFHVGRLAFTSPGAAWNPSGYEAYVEKVLAHAGRPLLPAAPGLLLFSSADDSPAVEVGFHTLLAPSFEHFQSLSLRGGTPFRRSEISGWGSLDDGPGALLGHPLVQEPIALVTLGHGLGPPSDGWDSREALRRELQGAMVFGDGEILAAPDIRDRAFLPGGVWFYLACFGVGTPARSVHAPWIGSVSHSAGLEQLLAGISPCPFIAALPQAALANPRGPLAVAGHADITWTFDSGGSDVTEPHRHLIDTLDQVGAREGRSGAGGRGCPGRLGHALSMLQRRIRELDSRIALGWHEGMDDASMRSSWMRRQDIGTLILLGDPAVSIASPFMAEGLPRR